MINPEMMTVKERLYKTEGLNLMTISKMGLVDKNMWIKYTGAVYSHCNAPTVECSRCRLPYKRTVANFNISYHSKDGLKKECKWCSRIAKNRNNAKLKKMRCND